MKLDHNTSLFTKSHDLVLVPSHLELVLWFWFWKEPEESNPGAACDRIRSETDPTDWIWCSVKKNVSKIWRVFWKEWVIPPAVFEGFWMKIFVSPSAIICFFFFKYSRNRTDDTSVDAESAAQNGFCWRRNVTSVLKCVVKVLRGVLDLRNIWTFCLISWKNFNVTLQTLLKLTVIRSIFQSDQYEANTINLIRMW